MCIGVYVCMYAFIYLPTYLSQCVLPIFSWTCGLPLEYGKLNVLLMSMFISSSQLLSSPPLPPETSNFMFSFSLFFFLNPFNPVCFGQLFLGIAPDWSIVDIPSILSLRETDFSSLSSNQMPLAPQLGMGLHAPLSSPPWDFVWLKYMQALCMLSQ